MIDSCEKSANWRSQSITNKQGSGGIIGGQLEKYVDGAPPVGPFCYSSLDGAYSKYGVSTQEDYLSAVELEIQKKNREVYEERLKFGVAKEQARKDLPVSNYTEMYAKCDLKNLLHFMGLRSDGHAQLEIRLYSDIICGIVKQLFPITFEAWQDYHFNASNFSRQEIHLINYQMGLQIPTSDVQYKEAVDSMASELGLSKREIEEYYQKIRIKEIKNFDLAGKELYKNE